MSAEVDIIGQQARSREGRGLSMRSGDSDKWIDIQKNTFMNWVNLQLQGSGYEVKDFEQDFDSGVTLCALVEALQQRRIGKVIKKPMNQHQSLENVTLALKAIAEDNVRLVNIGSEDIVNGSQKLILGLVWHLILRYQIGKTKFPPKKLMLAWLQAVIPDCRISNFTSDWNDGVALSALIEYCQPGLCPEWRQLSRQNRLENCTQAMNLAHQHLNIPMVVRPEDLASPHLDDLSGMTYLSYYMMQDSPGYYATRREIRNILQTGSFDNFTTDWEDGRLLCDLVKSVGGEVPGWPNLSNDRVENLQKGLDAGKRLGIGPIITAGEMADPEGEHLGIMAYAAYYTKLKPVKLVAKPPTFSGNLDNAYVAVEIKEEVKTQAQAEATRQEEEVEEELSEAHEAKESEMVVERHRGQGYNFEQMVAINAEDSPTSEGFDSQSPRSEPDEGEFPDAAAIRTVFEGTFDDVMCHQEKTFQIHLEDGSPDDIHAVLTGPNSSPPVHMQWSGSTASCSFTPVETGQHKLDVLYDNKSIAGCPVHFKVNADRSRVVCSPPDRACVGYPTDITVDISKAGQGDMRVEARSPSGRVHNVPALFRSGAYDAGFTPDEVGVWEVSVLYEGDHISGSPFHLRAFDPSLVQVYGLEGGAVGRTFTFNADSTQAGEGEVKVKVNYQGSEVSAHLVETSRGEYKVDFDPQGPGQYRVSVYMNDMEVRGSPYTLEIVDSSQVTLSGQGLSLVPVDMATTFTINTKGAGADNINVTITSPNGQNVPYKISGHGSSTLTVEYLPREVGTYTVNAIIAGTPIKGSPFKVKTYDPSKVKVSKISQGIVGVPNKFTVDASAAGEGTMEITVSTNGHNIPNQALAVGTGKYEVSFVGREAVTHQAVITYNGHHVPGSPFTVHFLDAGQMTASGEGLSLVANHRHTEFVVHTAATSAINLTSDLTADVTGPDGRSIPARLHDNGNGTYKVDWVPGAVGDHRVVVAYAGVPIGGSPYTVQVYDASLVTVSSIGQAFIGKPLTFTLDASKAGDGNLEIRVTADGESVPNYVRQERDAVFRVTFTPQRPSRHKISVTFNGEAVPGSPFTCVVLDTDSLTMSGDGLHSAPANVTTSFRIDPKGAGDFDLRAWVVSPYGHDVPVRITGNARSAYRIDYTPVDVGAHKVYVEYGGVEVRGSPFDVDVFDPALVRVNSNGRAYLNKPFTVYLDTLAAGKGTLEAEVKCRGVVTPCQLREVGGGRHELTFTARDVSTHLVNVTFNKVPLPEVPYHVDVIDGSSVTVSGAGLHTAKVYREAWFNLDLHGMDPQDLDIAVTGPSGSHIPCRINPKGHICRVEFTPMEAGPHSIEVLFAGSRVPGSPFICQAYDPSRVRITDVDRTAKKEREIGFIIDTSAAGMGELEVVISHHGNRVHTQRQLLGDGRYRYTFFPGETGHYEVKATFNEDNIPGIPLIINVEDEVPTFITISFRSVEPLNVRGDRKNYFMLHTDGNKIDSDMLDVNIEAPTGDHLDANLVENMDGDYRVEWTPKEPGRHSVDVLFAGQRVKGSPFYIEVFDITKIRVDNFFNGNVGEQAGFSVDTSRAGKCEQTVHVVGPTGRGIPVHVAETSTYGYNVTYEPSESGQHRIFLTYNSLELPGSPFTQEIGEGVLPPAYGDGLHRGEEDKAATFFIDARGMTGEPFVQVDGPNSIAKCSIEAQPDGQYMVTYIPVEVGMFDALVKWNGKELPGSPFHPKVVCARKVQVVGGWQHYMDSKERIHLVVNEEKNIPFEVAEAGPGKLTAEVKGPSGLIPVTVDDSTVGRSTVVFTPREEGIHSVYLYWSDTPLVNSPFQGYATSGALDPSKVILTGRGLKEAIVREEAEFMIDASQAGTGEPEVQLTGVRAEVNVFVTPLGGGKFRCTYIPVVPGAYLLHISWNGRQLRGSPYKVNIIGAFYPHKVIVSGEGLKGGLLGRDFDIRIDTRKAGPGELTAYCVGPSKVAHCELEDHHDGTFRLLVRPQEAGRHKLQVKYGGEHVTGSPFEFKVSAQPDASKVRVSGPGVEHGILATFQSRFVVETRGAGAGQLTVRIRGPKGAFQVEMYRDSQKDRTILCRYDPTETGLYIISVRWSGVDVPGSPFHVHILDTQSELEQVLADPPPFHNTSFPSSRASGTGQQWREEF
ncbi:filamin-B-like isoform X2 [Babylonia areolata]|uniref:filamin-B-like isoform X2 n=1 Tax=Babylonia areolata TaxID=304850 RepID=UPI003FD49879